MFNSKPGPKYHTTVCNVKTLSASVREELCELYLRYYDSSSRQRFAQDLAEKQEVLLLYYQDRLVGFTTLQYYDRQWQGRTIKIVYSGDTIVEQLHWGQQALAYTWIAHIGRIKSRCPNLSLYWLLIVKGHRTFKYLPAFARVFHPHWEQKNDDLRDLLNFLAIEKFGRAFDPETGLIEYAESRGQLKPSIATPAEHEMQKPAVRFFLERNSGYVQGDELACLCELSEQNLKPLAQRLFRKYCDDSQLETIASI